MTESISTIKTERQEMPDGTFRQVEIAGGPHCENCIRLRRELDEAAAGLAALRNEVEGLNTAIGIIRDCNQRHQRFGFEDNFGCNTVTSIPKNLHFGKGV